ncbi:hypothetical protein [Streptomyces sp. 351MFTsu5.1]|uniref:hypothetical protein n=1 Tax=Streptomyces sp. 351MFTsu5.1 TaxID=1172180 RepID=UPI000374081B|nr:hypothetical protein [Streptomyces sp. 351MFTsu5.1]
MTDYPDMDPFWVEARAKHLAAKSSHADPSACGTCRGNVAAGEPVEHDGCARRATLLQAPDHPHYELLAGFSLEDNEKLPARFHVPVFDGCGVPNSWLCAVCWEEGEVTGWPCATAQKYGTQVFSPEHAAETAHAKQQAELAALQAAMAVAVQRLQFMQSTEPDHVKAASLFEVEMGLRIAAGTQDEVTA